MFNREKVFHSKIILSSQKRTNYKLYSAKTFHVLFLTVNNQDLFYDSITSLLFGKLEFLNFLNQKLPYNEEESSKREPNTSLNSYLENDFFKTFKVPDQEFYQKVI